MRRPVGLVCIAAAFVVGVLVSHGCVDDRAKVRSQVFFCNPSSPTADADCGANFMCYGAAQAIGGSICVPKCDVNVPSSCNGACTLSGACLTRCTVPAAGQPAPCTAPLRCVRSTISALEAAAGPDGVCLPVDSSCTTSADCTSAVFTQCSTTTTGALGPGMTPNPGLVASGGFCVQGRCSARNIACEPGSACIPSIIPQSVTAAPDVCSPTCTAARDRPDGGTFNECLPGFTCLSDAFPQTDSPACAPGFAGWLCADNLGCTAGSCYDWGDIGPDFTGFGTCAPSCKSDDDCVPFDRGGNPSFVSRNICHEGKCRNFQSLFFPILCMNDKDRCKLDPEATCVANVVPDMGMVPQMGLGAFGGLALNCIRGCTDKSDCAPMAKRAHIPMTCGTIGSMPSCVPMVPFFIECKSDGDCFGDLTCETVVDPQSATTHHLCTRRCTVPDDCANDAALGSSFFCNAGNLCQPKIPSGFPAPGATECLSTQILNGKCVSPTGWACDANEQCANGQCNFDPGTKPPTGRCN